MSLEPPRRARDLDLLDAIDACPREAFAGDAWRVAREGRDPLLGSPSMSRWCNGTFDVLYTALDPDGALAEIHSLIALQPVFPSRIVWFVNRLTVSTERTLRLADMTALSRLGVDVVGYAARIHDRTQAIADAAFFLGFDGLLAPSARWTSLNLILFTERLRPGQLEIAERSKAPVDWADWRRHARR